MTNLCDSDMTIVMDEIYDKIIELLEADADIEIVSQSVSTNFQTGERYDKIVYHNKRTDTWFDIEKPKITRE